MYGGLRQRFPRIGPLDRQARVAAGHQPLTAIVRMAQDLDQASSEPSSWPARSSLRIAPLRSAEIRSMPSTLRRSPMRARTTMPLLTGSLPWLPAQDPCPARVKRFSSSARAHELRRHTAYLE